MSIGGQVAVGVTGGLIVIGSLVYGGLKEPKQAIRHTEGFPKGSKITHMYMPVNGTVIAVAKKSGDDMDSSALEKSRELYSGNFEITFLPKGQTDTLNTKTIEQRGDVIVQYDTLNQKLEK
jgi:hypothetical protein